MGVTIAPDGTLGTKDFFAKQGENGAFTGRSTYYFPKVRSMLPWSVTAQAQTKAAISREVPIRFRHSRLSGRDGHRLVRGRLGDKSPLKNAALLNVELDIKTPGTVRFSRGRGGGPARRRGFFAIKGATLSRPAGRRPTHLNRQTPIGHLRPTKTPSYPGCAGRPRKGG